MNPSNRKNLFYSRITERFCLNKNGSTKKTFHLSLSLAGSAIRYQPGDCVAIIPSNHPSNVAEILKSLHCSGSETIVDPNGGVQRTLSAYLTERVNLQKIHPSLIKKAQERSSLKIEFNETTRLADLLAQMPRTAISLSELPKLLMPMLPRFYSIASAQLQFPEEIHLIVALASYEWNGRVCYGVTSRFLCLDAMIGETPIPLYLHPSRSFVLPPDPDASIILIGCGTGVAPFRAFLQHRRSMQAKGRSWLFFGERNRETDYYYEEFFETLRRQGLLKLDLAFSRDVEEKFYVQHRMWEQRRDFWAWMKTGAYLYVCGDAQNMALDVDSTLVRIAIDQESLTEEEARRYLKTMRAEKRYLLDVY